MSAALHKPEFGQDGGPVVKPAGRVIGYNDRGKLIFIRLRDSTGELQVAVDKRRVSERDWQIVGLIDLGDQIVAEGKLGATKTGEVTVWANGVMIPAAKSLLPPPEKWQGLTDVELRYRQRYVDLFTNPDVMRVLKLRSEVVAEIRRYMTGLGYMEVETPMMQPLAGGAAAQAVHHAPQCAGYRPVPSHRPRTLSQAIARRRIHQSLRAKPQLPQRRHQPPP